MTPNGCARGRRRLSAALVTVGLLAVLAPAAVAGGSCTPLISDPSGDATITNPQDNSQVLPAGSDPALDLVRADLTADRRSLSMVVRTAADMRQSVAISGHSVELVFQALGERTWNLSATFPSVGPIDVRLGMVTGASAMPGEATLSADGTTLRATVPLEAFGQLAGQPLRQGARLSDLHLYTSRALAVGNSGAYTPTPADAAQTARTYAVGGASCVS